LKINNDVIKTLKDVKGLTAHDDISVYASDNTEKASKVILSNLFIEKDWKAPNLKPEGHYLNEYT